MKKITVIIIGVLMLVSIYGQSAISQRYGSDEPITNPVKVWGEVAKPGIYPVPFDYDLLGILSIAGGPINSAKLSNVKIIRAKRLDKDDPLVLYVDLEKYIETGDESLIPEIREGDTIMVPPKFGKDFVRNFAAILAIAQSITIMAYYIDNVVGQ
jgi:hypothetical protein